MNKIWTFLIIISLCFLSLKSPENVVNVLIGAAEKGVTLSISLIGVYAFWLGILQLLEKTGLNKKLSDLLNPVINFLFGKTSDNLKKDLSINLSSNMLGMGNVSTPSGIEAMQKLDKQNKRPKIASKKMIMLMILNTTAIQIIPTTVLGLRAISGSVNPSSIILPTLLATACSTALGIILVKAFYRGDNND